MLELEFKITREIPSMASGDSVRLEESMESCLVGVLGAIASVFVSDVCVGEMLCRVCG